MWYNQCICSVQSISIPIIEVWWWPERVLMKLPVIVRVTTLSGRHFQSLMVCWKNDWQYSSVEQNGFFSCIAFGACRCGRRFNRNRFGGTAPAQEWPYGERQYVDADGVRTVRIMVSNSLLSSLVTLQLWLYPLETNHAAFLLILYKRSESCLVREFQMLQRCILKLDVPAMNRLALWNSCAVL